MGKKKKTLAQKRLAELRHSKTIEKKDEQTPTPPNPLQPTAFTYTFSKTAEKRAAPTYSLSHELRKTLFVSGAIILFQILLFIILHNRVFMLPLESLRY